jgi:crotonobetainyl-CoA:carnitine CoA-transferase CaiB-like acyl-CoA transferase
MNGPESDQRRGPLADLRVLDLSTVIAGPEAARYLADFGADVIKIENPKSGDSLRNMGWRDPSDDVTLFWKYVSRNKRTIALDLKNDDDRALLLRLVTASNVFIENNRPGTLERLGLGPDVLLARNPKLVIVRVSGFGQDGPWANKPGFASIAESLSGWAAISGHADGQPLLPPIALTDEVTGLVAALAAMIGVHAGVGQVVDVNLLDSLVQLMGPLVAASQLLGYEHPRLGAGIPYTVPRGTFQCSDGKWVAISTSSDSVAARVMALMGIGDDERFTSFRSRVEHRDALDAIVTEWVAGRTQRDVIAAFEAAEAAIAPVYTAAELAADDHAVARDMFPSLDGVPMAGLIARFSKTPGALRWAGRSMNADGDDIRAEFSN